MVSVRPSFRELALSSGQYQSRAHDHNNYAEGRWDLFVMFCGNADVRIADADAMMVHVRKGHREGKNSQDKYHNSNQEQGFHKSPPEQKFLAGVRVSTRSEPLAAHLGCGNAKNGC
jgi:hypothetical protein